MTVTLDSWRRMWRELGAAKADDALFRRLVAAWSEPVRHYHSLQHLRECLELLEASRESAHRPAMIALALWFHDAVYNPRARDNEERSAQWAVDAVRASGLADSAADSVHALVMATKGHAATSDPDTQLLLDIDLAILGAPPARFAESTAQIREEYAHVPDDAWTVGRSRMLEGFLARPRIYITARFHAAREEQARANLAASLAILRAAAAAFRS
jgi:predicted metal-dependent HD superfamily phosphohydrolase